MTSNHKALGEKGPGNILNPTEAASHTARLPRLEFPRSVGCAALGPRCCHGRKQARAGVSGQLKRGEGAGHSTCCELETALYCGIHFHTHTHTHNKQLYFCGGDCDEWCAD